MTIVPTSRRRPNMQALERILETIAQNIADFVSGHHGNVVDVNQATVAR